LRISIPIDVWDPDRGGAERYILDLSRALRQRGHEVTIVCVDSRAVAAGELDPRLEILRVPRWPRWLRELRFAEASVRAHRAAGRDLLLAVRHALEADVYQPHGGSLRAARAAAGASLPPWRRALRDLAASLRPSLRVLLRLDREIFARSPSLVTVAISRRVEADLRRSYPSVRFRFEHVPLAVDLERFHDRDRGAQAAVLRARLGLRPAERLAAFVAHRFRPKGLAHAIAALPGAPGWHLVVAGRDRPGRFRRLARRLDVASRVHFEGAPGDVRPLLAGCEALVLPTYHDPCSLVVLEALACGTPAITTARNGASERLVHGRSGFVVERPDDVAGLSAALREAGERWDELHAAARAAVEGLTFGAHVDRMEQVLLAALRWH
jgi:UDP-glucose:(heptosyl)LPS alpha-1,3-glucosyltransferase